MQILPPAGAATQVTNDITYIDLKREDRSHSHKYVCSPVLLRARLASFSVFVYIYIQLYKKYLTNLGHKKTERVAGGSPSLFSLVSPSIPRTNNGNVGLNNAPSADFYASGNWGKQTTIALERFNSQ